MPGMSGRWKEQFSFLWQEQIKSLIHDSDGGGDDDDDDDDDDFTITVLSL